MVRTALGGSKDLVVVVALAESQAKRKQKERIEAHVHEPTRHIASRSHKAAISLHHCPTTTMPMPWG